MLIKICRVMALLFPVFLPTQAFWWRTSSTEAPPSAMSPVVMKQIPLTYFRTYTYQQPVTTNAVQLPLLSSADFVSNYNALPNTPYFNPMMPPLLPMSLSADNQISLDTRPSKSYAKFNMVRSLGPLTADTLTTSEPSTSTTTTTTTTTTTPEPTTTTTTTTESPTRLPVETTFPAFNRKAFTNHFNINYNRPVYPYPEYSLNEKNSASSNIEFVPCMCPVSVPKAGFSTRYQAGQPIVGNPSNSLFLAQGRTNVEAEAEAEASLSAEAKAAEENSDLTDDLEVVKLNVDDEAATSAQNRIA